MRNNGIEEGRVRRGEVTFAGYKPGPFGWDVLKVFPRGETLISPEREMVKEELEVIGHETTHHMASGGVSGESLRQKVWGGRYNSDKDREAETPPARPLTPQDEVRYHMFNGIESDREGYIIGSSVALENVPVPTRSIVVDLSQVEPQA